MANLSSVEKDRILHVGYNQDANCAAIGTTSRFLVYFLDPLEVLQGEVKYE